MKNPADRFVYVAIAAPAAAEGFELQTIIVCQGQHLAGAEARPRIVRAAEPTLPYPKESHP